MIQPRVFIAILDWGLGHATRCIPIINCLLKKEVTVILGSNGRAKQLLQAEFPQLQIIELPTYNIRYFSTKMWWNIIWQWPKIIGAAWKEHRQLQKIITQKNIDYVISDSRFGCFSTKVPCVFLTHQLHIRIPFKSVQFLVNKINHYFINRFIECWIPDIEYPNNLAGELAHPAVHKQTYYLGILSRMWPQNTPPIYPYLAVLSGPEPQRTYLEEQLISQATKMNRPLTIIQGKPASSGPIQLNDWITLIPVLTSSELNKMLCQTELVICRSGYTSLMDLAILGKKALLIPTPGQTEQEYLAHQLQQQGICHVQTQKDIDLSIDLPQAEKHPGFALSSYPQNQLEKIITRFLASK